MINHNWYLIKTEDKSKDKFVYPFEDQRYPQICVTHFVGCAICLRLSEGNFSVVCPFHMFTEVIY